MALKPCRECGHDVSTKAKACPSCGVDHPTRGALSRLFGGSGGMVVAVILGVVVVAAILSPSDDRVTPEPAPSGPLDLAAEVRRTSTQVTVTNTSAVAWTDCSIHVNPGTFDDGYVQNVARIGPGEVVAGGLMAFVDGDGARFNPGTHVVQNVDVRCQTPAGEGWYSGEF